MHTCVQGFDTDMFYVEVQDSGCHPQRGTNSSIVENVGIDPTTSHMQSERSTIWANSPWQTGLLWHIINIKFQPVQHVCVLS